MSEDTHSDSAAEAPGRGKFRPFFLPLVLVLIGFPIISLAVASWLARERAHLLSLSAAELDRVREGALEGALLPGMFAAFLIVAPLLCAHVFYLARTARKLRESRSALSRADEAKESLAAFLDASSGGYYLLDSELNYLDSHPGPSERTARLAREEIVGRNMAEVVPAAVESGRYEVYKNVIRTGKAVDIGEIPDASNRIISRLAFPVGTDRLGIISSDVTDRRVAQDALRSIVEGTSSTTGAEFFPAMVRHLASGLRLRYASVAETVGGDGKSANILAIWMGDHVAGPLSRELLDTPFARVIHEGRCVIPTGLQKRFPKDTSLSDLDADSFIGIALKDPDDRVLGYLCVLHDKPIGNVGHVENVISVFASRAAAEILRVQAETTLKEKQADLEEAQRVASVGNWSKDLATGTTSWSDEMYRIYGFAPQSVPSTWETAAALIHPDDLELVHAVRADLTHSEVEEITYRITRPDGEDRFLRGRLDVIRDSEGKPVRVVGTIQDITERKQAEAAKEEYHARSIGVIQNSVDSIITIDDRGVIESVNPAALGLFGYEKTELVGQNVSVLMPESYRGNHDQFIEAYKTSGSKKILDTVRETQGVQKDGTTFPLRISVTEVRFGGRRIFAGIIHDLTHESELERQLLQAQKLESVGTLAGGIAHDFNNILQAILGFNALAQENMEGDTELLTQCLDEIEAGSRRAADLVNQILSFSRTSEIDYRPLTLQPLIEEALRFLRSSMPATIRIDKRISPDCDHVLGNATQIHQVVANLCTNAMHAMEAKGGCLTVSLEPLSIGSRLETLCGPCEPGESVQLSVTDTGTGIEPKLIERLIDPFFTTKEVGKGTGLGLAMVHGIVRSMWGGLLIESELGSGTKVRVIFPLVPENQVLKKPKEPARAQDSGAGNVMIVDDEEAITKLTARMLESRGFTVDSFTDGGVALEALKVAPTAYDVAVLDYTMPGRTGGDLAREFRALAAEMPVILATGHIDELEHEQTSSPNIVDIIKKPFDIDALVSAINRSR
jgi:PAS domain S-box-containing protein